MVYYPDKPGPLSHLGCPARIAGKKKRDFLGAAALAVLAPGGTAQAMKLAFTSVARGSLATGEKGGDGRIDCGL